MRSKPLLDGGLANAGHVQCSQIVVIPDVDTPDEVVPTTGGQLDDILRDPPYAKQRASGGTGRDPTRQRRREVALVADPDCIALSQEDQTIQDLGYEWRRLIPDASGFELISRVTE